MKNAFVTEATTANAGIKFIIRDIAQQVGEHKEKKFVQMRQKQDRDAQLERKGVGFPPSQEECSKEAFKSFIQDISSGSLFTFDQLSGFFFHT